MIRPKNGFGLAYIKVRELCKQCDMDTMWEFWQYYDKGLTNGMYSICILCESIESTDEVLSLTKLWEYETALVLKRIAPYIVDLLRIGGDIYGYGQFDR